MLAVLFKCVMRNDDVRLYVKVVTETLLNSVRECFRCDDSRSADLAAEMRGDNEHI